MHINLKQLQNLQNTALTHLINFSCFLKGAMPLPPVFINLIITYKCNLNCDFCAQKRDLQMQDMTLADVQAIQANIKSSFYFRPRIHIFGGEPLINKDFLAIVNFLSEKKYRISLTTNGLEIPKIISSFKAVKNLKEINLSINGVDCKQQLQIVNMLKSGNQINRIYLNVNCPITPSNQSRLFDILGQFIKSGIDCFTFQHAMKPDKSKYEFLVIQKQLNKVRRQKLKFPVVFFPGIKIKDIADYYLNSKIFPRGKNTCVFPWFVLMIRPDCEVSLCNWQTQSLGNAKEQSLKIIWNNNLYKQCRRDIIAKGAQYFDCTRCCHRKYY